MTVPVLIRADRVPAQPWRNGGGRTHELLTRPAGARNWRLRISVAEVDREGPFSVFPGIRRWFTVLDGAGLQLKFHDSEQVLDAGHEPVEFDGEAPVECRLIDGPTRDLNLMHAGGAGLMQVARSGESWQSEYAQRGLFTRLAGRWHAEGHKALDVPAFALLWMDDAHAGAWTFRAAVGASPAPNTRTADEPPVPAYWLAWDP
jgi:hypothetical protein